MRPALIALTTCTALALAACASTAPAPAAPPAASGAAPVMGAAHMAAANLVSTSGSLVSGRLLLMPMGGGVHVAGDIGGLAPGSVHGFHIHETGDCSAADGSSAGGHFNPAGSPHGRAGAGAHHAGDVDNLTADGSGVAHVDVHLTGVALGGGGADDILGRAFVVHAAPDDYHSQPSGNAGARVACGVITAMPQ